MTTNPVVTVTDELLEELEQLASKATPGPWGYDGSYVCTISMEGETRYVESWNPVADALLTKNVSYISKANPATVLSLLHHIRTMQQELKAAHISVDNCELFRKDAERLAWLRDDCDFEGFQDICALLPDEWAEYIDAAMAASHSS